MSVLRVVFSVIVGITLFDQIAATLPEKHEQFSGPDKSSGLATLSAWKSKCVESDDVKKCIREIPKEDIAKVMKDLANDAKHESKELVKWFKENREPFKNEIKSWVLYLKDFKEPIKAGAKSLKPIASESIDWSHLGHEILSILDGLTGGDSEE